MVRLAYGNQLGKVVDREHEEIIVEWESGMVTREHLHDLEWVVE